MGHEEQLELFFFYFFIFILGTEAKGYVEALDIDGSKLSNACLVCRHINCLSIYLSKNNMQFLYKMPLKSKIHKSFFSCVLFLLRSRSTLSRQWVKGSCHVLSDLLVPSKFFFLDELRVCINFLFYFGPFCL